MIAAELIVTGDVPDEVSVTDCVVEVFTVTLPKLKRSRAHRQLRTRRRRARTAQRHLSSYYPVDELLVIVI